MIEETVVALLRLTLSSRSLLEAPYKNRLFHELVKNTLRNSHPNKCLLWGALMAASGDVWVKTNRSSGGVREQIKTV